MRGTLILVEADPLLLDALADLFEGVGYRVSASDDSRAVLRAAARAAPDLAVVDVALPRGDGRILATCLQEWDVPVVLLGAGGHEPPRPGVLPVPWPLDVAALLDLVAHAVR